MKIPKTYTNKDLWDKFLKNYQTYNCKIIKLNLQSEWTDLHIETSAICLILQQIEHHQLKTRCKWKRKQTKIKRKPTWQNKERMKKWKCKRLRQERLVNCTWVRWVHLCWSQRSLHCWNQGRNTPENRQCLKARSKTTQAACTLDWAPRWLKSQWGDCPLSRSLRRCTGRCRPSNRARWWATFTTKHEY